MACLGALLLLLAACHPNTTRPGFAPRPGAWQADLLVGPDEGIQLLADALRRDSLPVTLVSPRDGYLETAWFDTAGSRPAGEGHFGAAVVRIRGWTDPGPPHQSHLTVEGVYRPLANPAEPERELERELPPGHPTALRLRTIMDTLTAKYGKDKGDSTTRN